MGQWLIPGNRQYSLDEPEKLENSLALMQIFHSPFASKLARAINHSFLVVRGKNGLAGKCTS